MSAAAQVIALPGRRTVLLDQRGSDRALRVTWHDDADDGAVVVLSVWRGDRCAASFRLAAGEVPVLVDALVRGLAEAPGTSSRPSAASAPLPHPLAP